jgi:glycosyltransferase involved in cell wall biosynthesis
MRKVLIGTPAYDGRVDVWYANSLVNTVKLSIQKDIEITPVYMAYDSLVQRARNDLVRLAIEGDFDDLIFIDSDEEWDPNWIFTLLDYEEDIVGVPVVKKSDQMMFNIKALPTGLKTQQNGLMEVEAVGTGFMKISRAALKKVWDVSEEYKNEGRTGRLVFDIRIVEGDLVSEDIIFCQKWRELDGKIWINPAMTCNHIGIKKYSGNFLEYLKFLETQNKQGETKWQNKH